MSKTRLNKIKQRILGAAYGAGEGHVPSAYSVLDILWVLYDRVMTVDCKRPCDPGLDRFVLSKGHASLALYAVLAEKGFFPVDDLDTFCRFESNLGGHPDCRKVPGVEASTGSLGHGLPMAVGMAMGSRIRGIDNRIFCLVGDGECNEGTIWESALLAAHHQLSNLCVIVDYNHSTDRALNMGDLAAKFSSFGWESRTVAGHDADELFRALKDCHPTRPLVVVATTIKGFGVQSMESEPAWHHRAPTSDEFGRIIAELT